jgi:hypothetical protein
MTTSTSIGRGPASGGNENHDSDPTHTTMGETVGQERPAGNAVPESAAQSGAELIRPGQGRPGPRGAHGLAPEAENDESLHTNKENPS